MTTEMMVVRLRLIGQMSAWTIGGADVLPSGRKTQGLLALIALSGSRPSSRARLAELLWSQRPEEQARASLRQEIHRLLESFSPANREILLVTRDHLSLKPDTVWIDVDEVARASTEQPAGLCLMDGDLLEGLEAIDPGFDTWLAVERDHLRDRARSLAESLLHAQTEAGVVIPAALRLLQIDRSHEGAWRALMRAHAERGERGLAVQAYDRCRAAMASLLDAAPSNETQKLLADIRGASANRPLPPSARGPKNAGASQPAAASAAQTFPGVGQLQRQGASIGVLPPRCIGLSEDEAALAPALADEITAALSRFRWLAAMSISPLAPGTGEPRDEAVIGRTLGIDFLLTGTLQRNGGELRVSLRLLDLRENSQVVWARRFERDADDPMTVLDELAGETAAQVEQEMIKIESGRATARPGAGDSPYELLMRSVPLLLRLERDGFNRAGEYLERALVIDPDNTSTLSVYTLWHLLLLGQLWAADPDEAVTRSFRLVDRAVVLDPASGRALSLAGHVRAVLGRGLHEAAALHDRALRVNPYLGLSWALSAATQALLGETDDAEAQLTRYKTLVPFDPLAFMLDPAFTLVHLLKRDYPAAVFAGRASTQLNPGYMLGYIPYLAAVGHLGDPRESAEVLRRLLVLEPNFTVERFLSETRLESKPERDHYAEGLRRAGAS